MATANSPGSGVPPFSLDGSRHDLSTYWGRVTHFFELVDPRNNLLRAADAERGAALLEGFKSGAVRPGVTPGVTDADLWDAKHKVAVVLHPDTGLPIPAPLRMCAFMPVNLPITAGMLLTGPGGAAQLFWQFVNQSYNAGFNYANRNASAPMDWGSFFASYGIATTTAVGMAAGLGRVVAGLQARVAAGTGVDVGPGGTQPPMPLGVKLLSRGLPWLAVASAGAANVLAMRYREGIDGIAVYDDAGGSSSAAPVGTSVSAGRTCLAQVALTRVVLPIPILLLPPFILDAARASKLLGPLMARSVVARMGVELSIIAVFLQLALPFAVAVFPQRGAIAAESLEPQFRGRKAPDGSVITTYYYNKGL